MKKQFLSLGTLSLMLVLWLTPSLLQAQPDYQTAARFSRNKVDKMVFSTSVMPTPFQSGNTFYYSYKTPQGTHWWVVDPVKGTKQELFDNNELAAQLTEIVKDPFDALHLPIRNLKLKDNQTFTFEVQGTEMVAKKETKDKDANKPAGEKTGPGGKEPRVFYFEYQWANKKLTWLEDKEKEKPVPRWASISPNQEYVVFSRNFDLYWMDWENFLKARENEKDSTIVEHRLTTTGTRDFPFGSGSQDFYADSTELNKRTGAWVSWSPNSQYFALIRQDETKVKDLWVIDALANPRPKLERYKYEMPGEAQIPQTHLVVFNMADKSYKTIATGAFKDQFLDILYKPRENKDLHKEYYVAQWQGGNDYFYFYRSSRDLKRIDLCKTVIGTDTTEVLVEERMNTYQEVLPPRFVSSGKQFIHWSERNGWAHLYLYNSDGTLQNAITKGPWHVDRVLGVDEATRTVYFMACGHEEGEDPYYQHLYSVKFDGSNLRLLTPGNFHWSAYAADNAKYFVTNRSRVDAAPVSELFDANGRKIMELEATDISLLEEAGYKYPEPFTVKAADGITNLYGVMYKPFNFDPTKKYPIITYVYPGPQVEGPSQSWSRSLDRLDRLAQLGFIVISVGNRGGHPDRSKWYHNFGYGNLRDYGLEDQKYAIEQLAARYAYVDLSRVGIHGHSGGGFMSTAALLKYPDFFKVAVSCAGNHENNIYNRWWSETHHGVKEEVSAKGDTTFVYNIATNSQLAKNLKGHLLLIHGDIDNNVHPANTFRVANALIRANKRFDMLILPGQRHGFGDMTEYFFWKMADYFCLHLLGQCEESVDIPQMNNN